MGKLPDGLLTHREQFEQILDQIEELLGEAIEHTVYQTMISEKYPHVKNSLLDASMEIVQCREDLEYSEENDWEYQ